MKMTHLALPKPGPPVVWAAVSFADAFWSANICARLTPRMPEPQTRRRSRRVRPSHVSPLAAPGITSMAGLQRQAGGRQNAVYRPGRWEGGSEVKSTPAKAKEQSVFSPEAGGGEQLESWWEICAVDRRLFSRPERSVLSAQAAGLGP